MSGEGGDESGGSTKGKSGGDLFGSGDSGGSDYTNGGFGNPGASTNTGYDPIAGTYSGGSNAFAGDTSSGAGSLDSFIADPSGGNLSGPGPVGGDSGFAGAGGGTNTPLAFSGSGPFENLPNSYGIDPSQFTGGSPAAAGGVFSTGGTEIPYSSGTSGDAVDMLSGVSAPAGGTSAAGIAAPSGVAGGSPDATGSTSITNDLDANRTSLQRASGGGSSGGGSDITRSLGIGGNPLGVAAAGAGLLNNLINPRNNQVPYSPDLNANAASARETSTQQVSAGQALQQWQTTGTLPASYESQVQQAAQAARTRAISNAAAQGLPTDPTHNTTLAQSLQAIDAAIPQQREQIAKTLADSGQAMINAGLSATGVSSSVYQTLANLQNSQNQQQGQAIANFASALNGGNRNGVTLNVGGTQRAA